MVLLFLLSGCSVNRYLLTDVGPDELYLIGIIKEMAGDGQISRKPLVLVNLEPHVYPEQLKQYRLPLSKEMIEEIWSLEAYAGKAIYGKSAEGGVVVINTREFLTSIRSRDNYDKVLFLLEIHRQKEPGKILILLDDKKISKEEVDKLNLNQLKSIQLVTDTSTFGKYSTEEYDKIYLLKR